MLLQLASLFTAIVSVLAVPTPLLNPPPLVGGGKVGGMSELTAVSSFLVDTASGTILHAQDADRELPIASITKLMTALMLLEARPDWSQRVTFEARDRRNGDIAYLIPGEEITVQNAWNLMLTASSNDATALLARVFFVDEATLMARMNEQAATFGFKHTKFTDPTGLDPGNISTTREVAALARLALARPEIRQTLLRKEYTFAPIGKAERRVRSTNQLLNWFRYPGVTILGGKTGHIEESGYNLVFAASDHTRELIGVVLGSADNDARFMDMSKLLKWGFSVALR